MAEIFSPLKLNYHKNSRLYFFVRKVTNSVVNSANNYFSHYMQSYQKNKSKKGKKFPSEKPLLQFYFVWQKTVMAFPRGFFSLYVMFIYTYVCFGWGEVHIVLRSILVKAEVGYWFNLVEPLKLHGNLTVGHINVDKIILIKANTNFILTWFLILIIIIISTVLSVHLLSWDAALLWEDAT